MAIALAIVALLGGYLLNERASRRALEREKRYERSLQAYEQILKALKDLFRAVRVTHAQTNLQVRSGTISQPPNEVVLDIAITNIGLSELGLQEETRELATLLLIPKSQRTNDWREQVATALAVLSSGTWHRSQQAMNDALSVLVLMAASPSIRDKALSVYDGLDAFAGKLSGTLTTVAIGTSSTQVTVPKLPFEWFDHVSDELETLMQADLQRILKGEDP